MRILLITQYWAPENGVPQRRWAWLTKLLSQAGHEIMVIAPPPHYLRKITIKGWIEQRGFKAFEDKDSCVNDERIIRSGYFPGGSSLTGKVFNQIAVAVGELSVVLRRGGAVDQFGPELVIGTVPALPTAFVAAVASRKLRVPYVIDLRDAWPELLSVASQWNSATGRVSWRERLLSKGPLQLASWAVNLSLDRILRNAKTVIVTSSRLARDINSRAPVGKPAVTLRNVFPPETRINKVPDLNRASDSLNVLYAGTLGRAQNLTNALRAAALAKEVGVDVRIRFVGAGAARTELVRAADELNVDAIFEHRRDPQLLSESYQWADTALVHLTDWEPLLQAVPSKTYELMDQGIHISGVVDGETADLIRALDAGHVVPPEQPRELARLWVRLANDRTLLDVPRDGTEWVRKQREDVAPLVLRNCLSSGSEEK